MCVNDTLAFDIGNSPRINASYLARPPDGAVRRLQRMLLLLQFTLPGAPVIYYGDEAGMWGGDDPDNRKPMIWPDMRFADERSFEVTGDPDRYPVVFDSGMYRYYRALIALREKYIALRSGTMQTLQLDDVTGLYVFMRAAGAEKIYVAVNTGDNSRQCALTYLGLPEGIRLVDPIHNVSFYTRRDQVSFVIPPRTVSLLIPDQ
jgi:glycosidase